MSAERLAEVTPQEALRHPTWDMGLMVTTNSATLVNKGLEVIEAHLLFDVPLDAIDVVVHPQSIVHSMVEFTDGATIAQASPPDMRLPISLGLDWPHRVPGVGVPLDFTTAQDWTFEPLDEDAFPAVADREAGRGRRRHGARRSSTRRTRRRCSRSTPGGSASPTSSARSGPCSTRCPAETGDLDRAAVLEADRRGAGRRLIGSSPELIASGRHVAPAGGAGRTYPVGVTVLLYLVGILVDRRRRRAVDRAARGRPPGAREAVRRPRDAVHDRLRPHRVRPPPRRDRVRPQAVPLGGYISMVGMFPPAKAGGRARTASTGFFNSLVQDARDSSREQIHPGEEHRAFYRLAVWKRVVIMLGGPTMNLLLGILFIGDRADGLRRLPADHDRRLDLEVHRARDQPDDHRVPVDRPGGARRGLRPEAGRPDPRGRRRRRCRSWTDVTGDHPQVRRQAASP